MNDARTPLKPGAAIAISGNTYRISGLLSDKGGSCLAYKAEREPSDFEKENEIPPVPAVVKEFYPAEHAHAISRNENGVFMPYTDCKTEINVKKTRFIDAAKRQIEFYKDGGEHSFAPTRTDEANNTVYTVVDEAHGDTLDNAYSSLSRYEKSEVLVSLCEAIVQLHNSNRLYLDIKPSNIWLFEKSEQSRRVALFDFDAVLPTDDYGRLQSPYPNNIPVSDGWSPREQQSRQQYTEICRATDVYAFGAVIYWLYMGKPVDTSALSDINANNLAFLDASGVFYAAQKALADVKSLLRNSLRHAVKNRAENLESLVASLKTLREHLQTASEQPALSDQLDRMEGKIDRGFQHRATAGVAGNAVCGAAIASENTQTGSAGFSSVRGVGFKPRRHNEYYNLFVLDDDEYTQGNFCIDKSRSITQSVGVKPETIRRFADVCENPATANEVKAMPSLFLKKNATHSQAHERDKAYYGVVESICDMGGSIQIRWKRLQIIRQQTLNERAGELGILASTAQNELDSSRWSIKPVDLIPALEKAGIVIEFTEGV